MLADMIQIFAPLALFMLLPVWIPIIAVLVGKLTDSLRGHAEDPVVARLAEVKQRSIASRPATEAA